MTVAVTMSVVSCRVVWCGFVSCRYVSPVGVHNTEYVVDDILSVSAERTSETARRLTTGLRKTSDAADLGSMGSISGSGTFSARHHVSKIVGPEAYYIGIVDFQQEWDFSKKVICHMSPHHVTTPCHFIYQPIISD